MSCLGALLHALFYCLNHSLYHSITLWITWTWRDVVEAVLVCKSFKLFRGKLWTVVWHHSFGNSILAKHLFQDIDCCTGSSATYSSDDWEPAVVIRNQQIAVRLKFEEINGQLLSRSLGNFMWHQRFSLLALGKGLAHIATLGCLKYVSWNSWPEKRFSGSQLHFVNTIVTFMNGLKGSVAQFLRDN